MRPEPEAPVFRQRPSPTLLELQLRRLQQINIRQRGHTPERPRHRHKKARDLLAKRNLVLDEQPRVRRLVHAASGLAALHHLQRAVLRRSKRLRRLRLHK